MNRIKIAAVLLGVGLMTGTVAAPSRRDEMTVMDSLRTMPPKRRLEWMHERGIEMPGYAGTATFDSGLTLVGKWGRGPAAEVTGKDTLVVLTLGSEVALLSFANPDSPKVLSEIQFPSLVAQSYLKDSLLYTSSNADLEIWNIADPTQPVKRGELPAPVGDFWMRDTFLYYIRRDAFHVLSIASPSNLYELGSCVESGSATTGSGNTVVVCQSGGFAFVDVSNPASPHEVGTYPCGHPLSATARGNLVCASYEETSDPYPVRFITLDMSDPANPRQLARLNDLGGYDIYLDGPLAFVSGRAGEYEEPFQIISVADSLHPVLVDTCRTTDYYNWGVWVSPGLNRAFVADDYDGLAVIDISNLNNLQLDTSVMVAATAEDVFVDGQHCYVADGMAGLAILDVSDPTRPTQVSGLDTAYGAAWSYAVVARDSFAYWGWYYPYFRTVDVSDPRHPLIIGSCFPPDQEPKDMVLRDSFVYAALDGQFNVINVARPREPEVVGTCGLQNASLDLFVSDSLAYVGNWPSPIISISDPAHPVTVGNFPMPLGGVYVRDTFAYLAMSYDSMFVYSVANPALPVRLGSLDFAGGQHYAVYNVDIEVVDTIAYIGGTSLKTVSVADPRSPREVGTRWNPPSLAVSRLAHTWPYLYVACSDGGVCIMETLQTGVSESARRPAAGRISVTPSPTRGPVRVTVNVTGRAFDLEVFDVTGNLIQRKTGSMREAQTIDLTSAPDGAYLVMVKTEVGMSTTKVVKTRR